MCIGRMINLRMSFHDNFINKSVNIWSYFKCMCVFACVCVKTPGKKEYFLENKQKYFPGVKKKEHCAKLYL